MLMERRCINESNAVIITLILDKSKRYPLQRGKYQFDIFENLYNAVCNVMRPYFCNMT